MFGSRWLVVILARYLEGTLRYDELAFGTAARHGAAVGLFVDRIWVDDPASRSGGRRIWGLPKEMAAFAWDGGRVRVTDETGLVVALSIDERGVRLPRLWLSAPVLGRLDGRLAFAVARLSVCLARTNMRIGEWSERFPYRPAERARLGFAGIPFRMTVPPPRLLGRSG